MKKIICVLLLLTSLITRGQELVEKVILQNGKVVLLYSDNSWRYAELGTNEGEMSAKNQKEAIDTTKSKNRFIGEETALKNTSYSSGSYSSICGARNKKGGYCKRKVSGGGRCYQHK